MKKEQIKGSLSLFLAAIIWGAAFVAQSVGMDYVGPFTFGIVLNVIFYMYCSRKTKNNY